MSGDCQSSERDHLSPPLCSAAQTARKLLLNEGRGSGRRRDHRREDGSEDGRGVEEAKIGIVHKAMFAIGNSHHQPIEISFKFA